MKLRRIICWITIVVFLGFTVLVYAPQIHPRENRAALSILSDCTDARTAMVTLTIQRVGMVLVDILLLDAEGKGSPGTCKELRVEFPGQTDGGEILSGETFQIPPAPQRFLKQVDAGARLTREAGIGAGETLSVNLTGASVIPPSIRFRWRDAVASTNFATNEISLPLTPISVNGSPLVPVKHVELQFSVPNELESATLTPSPMDILPVGNNRVNKYDFPTGASVVTLTWTNSLRSLIKEAGVIIFSLLAGAAVSDLLTSRPEPASPVKSPTAPHELPPTKRQKSRR